MTTPAPGKPFGPYAVEMPVGQGGMGAVYRARDPKLGRTIALKVMLAKEADDPESRARFVREARLAAQLEHPGIVRIYEVGEVDGTPFIAMEWIEGRTLRAAKVERPIPLLTAIAETLAHAHERGVIHRDLKPANVMVDAHGDPKLVDFGLAKRVVGPSTFATQDGTVLGTPNYMAPEQELSTSVDARADQFAWGVLAYELLTGEKPARPALSHAALDEHHGAIVLRALSISPSDRFASMRDLLAAWRPPLPEVRVPSAEPIPQRPAGHTKLYFATAAAVTCLGLVVAFFVGRSTAKVETTTVPAKVEAPVTTTSPLASADDVPSAEPPPSASAPATATAKPAPAPSRPTVRSLGTISIDGSADVDRDEVLAQLREQRPTLQRCVVDLDIPSYVGRNVIASDVYFRANGVDPHVLEVVTSWASTDGTGLRKSTFPPASTVACLTSAFKRLKVTRPKEDSLTYARVILELRR